MGNTASREVCMGAGWCSSCTCDQTSIDFDSGFSTSLGFCAHILGWSCFWLDLEGSFPGFHSNVFIYKTSSLFIPDLSRIHVSNGGTGICASFLFHLVPNWGLPWMSQYVAADLWAVLPLAMLGYQGKHSWFLWGGISDPLSCFQLKLSWYSHMVSGLDLKVILEGNSQHFLQKFHLGYLKHSWFEKCPCVQSIKELCMFLL